MSDASDSGRDTDSANRIQRESCNGIIDKPESDDDSCLMKATAVATGQRENMEGVVKQRRAVDDDKDNVPKDRGWAWVILVASTIEFAIVIGHMKCSGIFFVEWQEKFHSSASATSMVSMIRSISYSITALIVMTFGMQHISCRASVIFGSALEGCAYLIAAFAEDIRLIYISHGVLDGMSIAFLQPAVVTMINTYFEKYRGLSNNIACAGASIGGLTLVPLYTKLFSYYGYTGTFIIASGIVFNVIIAGALLRPIESYWTRRTDGHFKDKGNSETLRRGTTDKASACDNEPVEYTPTDIYSKHYIERTDVGDKLMNGIGSKTPINCSETNLASLNGSAISVVNMENFTLIHCSTIDSIHCSLINLHIKSSQKDTNQYEHERDTKYLDDNHKGTTCTRYLCAVYRAISAALEFRVLKNPLCIYYLAFTGLLCAGHSLPGVFLAPYAHDLGIDDDHIARLLIVVCVVDLMGKLSLGFISDRNWVRRSTLTAMASSILGVACHMMYFMSSFESLMIFAVVLGLLQGVYFSMYAVIIVDYLSLENLKPCMGFTALMQGMAGGFAYPLAGVIRDVTGEYLVSYNMIGILLLLGAAMCGCLPIVQRWTDRRHARKLEHIT